LQPHIGRSANAFVAKLTPDGSALAYSTYLGGSGDNNGSGIAVDAAGSAYVIGRTMSPDFPTVNALMPTRPGQGGTYYNAFVAKLTADGSALVYSTYLGGSGGDVGTGIAGDLGGGIAVDAAGNAYVTGFTTSFDFPTVNPLQPIKRGPPLGHNAFVAKFSAAGNSLVYSTYLGGSGHDGERARSIAVDAAGNAYITGSTDSPDFPTANALQPALGSRNGNAFIAKLTADGSGLVYSTYLGGTGNGLVPSGNIGDYGHGIAVDAAGNAYVVGETASPDFPTANPLQPTLGGSATNAFVAKLTPDGSALVYSTYLGGSGQDGDSGWGIAVDGAGNAYVTGGTSSPDFPTANPLPPALLGSYDGFVAQLTADGSALVYSTYLGGSGRDGDLGWGIAVDGAGNAYVVGETASPDFPTANPLQPVLRGNFNAFVVKISP
jgi:hypothetical protein